MAATEWPEGHTVKFLWMPHEGKLVLVFRAGCPAFALAGATREKEVKKKIGTALAAVSAVSVLAGSEELERWRVVELADVEHFPVAYPLEVELDDYRGACAVLFKAEQTLHRGAELWLPFRHERWSPETLILQFSDGRVWELK